MYIFLVNKCIKAKFSLYQDDSKCNSTTKVLTIVFKFETKLSRPKYLIFINEVRYTVNMRNNKCLKSV